MSLPTFAEIEEDGVASVDYHGIPMIAFTDPAFKRLMIRHRGEKRDLELALQNETIDKTIAIKEFEAMRNNQKALEWKSNWGPPLAFAGGVTVAGVLAAVLFAVLLGGVK